MAILTSLNLPALVLISLSQASFTAIIICSFSFSSIFSTPRIFSGNFLTRKKYLSCLGISMEYSTESFFFFFISIIYPPWMILSKKPGFILFIRTNRHCNNNPLSACFAGLFYAPLLKFGKFRLGLIDRLQKFYVVGVYLYRVLP